MGKHPKINTVSYLSWMIPADLKFRAKITKGTVILLFFWLLSPLAHSQTALQLAFDSKNKEIILLNGADSVLALPFTKTFKARLNAEKNRKQKTVYYRLAEYAAPTNVTPVPIGISNSQSLELEGTLTGDTTAAFRCVFHIIDSELKIGLETKNIATNQFAFQLKLFPTRSITIQQLKSPLPMYSKKKKGNVYIIIRGNRPELRITLANKSVDKAH